MGELEGVSERYRLDGSRCAHLSEFDPDEDGGIEKKDARKRHRKNVKKMAKLQFRLHAENRRRLLVVLQGPDTGGKDSTVRRVFSGMNPQGCKVTSFKAPSEEERDHGFLWRIHRAVPRRGNVGVFNRSHYEDVLVARVHGTIDEETCWSRYGLINRFEHILVESEVTLIKIYLHISREEQTRRLQRRLDDPDRRWKLSASDLEDRHRWHDFMQSYEDAINACAAPHAPWYVVPANRKWYRDLVVSDLVRSTLETMDPRLPEPELDVSEVRLD